MNQNRAQRFPTGLLAWLGLILGFSFGLFLDQAANVPFDGNLMPALRACNYCLAAAIPVAVEVVKVNRFTLLGSILGLLAGVVMAALPRLRPRPAPSRTKRLSSFRQAAELARFSRALSDSLELQSILNQLHEEVLRVTGADCGSSFLLDPESPENRVAVRVGEGAELLRLNAMETAAVSAGRGRIVQDFELEGEAPPHVGVRSALLVPITHEENAIGLIHVHSDEPGAFDSEFQDFVQALASQAAVAIQNARRYADQAKRSEGLRQRVNQLQQLSQIPNAVRVDRPLTTNLTAIAQSMQETADFRLVLISVFAPAGNQLVHTSSAGLSPESFENLQHLPLPWERLQPFLREENRSEHVYRVPHTQTADLYQALDLGRPGKANEPATLGQWHPNDMLLVPLYGSRGEIEGLLSVGAPRDTTTPQGLVLDMLEIFAGQAALAIENAHLVKQAEERVSESQERAVQLSALTEAASVIATALHADEVVTLSLDQMRRVLPYDTASFWQRELSDGHWRVLGTRSYADAIEHVVSRMQGAQATVFSEIVTTRSVVFVPDVSRDERFTVKEASSMRSWMGVPILSNGAVLGVLALEKGEDNFYGPAQVPLALSFANRVAVALDNARLYEQSVQHAQDLEKENTRRAQDVDQRSQRLALLNRLATDLSQARDLAGLLGLTLDTLLQALGVSLASGLILDGEAGREAAHILAVARRPASSPMVVALDLVTNPLLDRLQETGAPLIAEAASSPAETVARPEHFVWVGPEASAALFLPLLAEGRLLGVIGLGLPAEAAGRKFTAADADLGRAVVQQTVTALQFLQLRDRAQEQSAVQQVTRAIGRATDFTQLYQVIRLQLAEAAGLHSLSLALYDPARNRVSFPLIVEKGQLIDAIDEAHSRTPGGLVGYIVQTRQTVRLSGEVVAQAKEIGLTLGLPDQHPLRGGPEPQASPVAQAYLGVPLLLGDKLIGALVAQDVDHPEAFDDRTERLLAATAAQSALAIDNLRLFDEARQTLATSQERATQFETLTEAAVALASTLHSDEVISAALEQMRRLVPYDTATFWQRAATPAQRRGAPTGWRAAAARGRTEPQSQAGQVVSIEPRTPLGDVIAARRTQVVADTRRDARFEGSGRGGTWMGVPVVSQGQVVALLELEKAEAGALTARHVPLAQSLSTRIAQALNNAEQYEASLSQKNELAEQTRRLAILNRAAVALSGLLELGEVLNTTLRLTAEALNLDRVGLVVFDENTSKPIRAAAQPAEAAQAPMALATLATNPLLERLRQASGVVTLDELAAEQPVPQEQMSWVGGGVATGWFRLLTFNGRTVGLLGAGQAQAGRTFTAAEISLAQEICRFAAAAIFEVSRYETIQEQLSEQVLVNQMARAISQALDARQLGQLLRTQLDAWLAPAQIRLALYDEARHEVGFALAVVDGQTVALGPQAPDPVLRLILQTQQPLLMTGGAELPQQLEAAGLPPEALAPAHSYLGVPLVLGSAEAARVLGVLALADPGRTARLTESHERVLAALAVQVAISLDNARLYAVSLARVLELDERAQRLGWLNRTVTELGRTLDLEAVLPIALRALTELLPAEQAGILLFDEALETGRVVAKLAGSAGQPAESESRLTSFSLAGQGWWERWLPRLRESPAPLPLGELSTETSQAANPLAWLGTNFTSALLLPLHAASGLVGLIALGRTQPGRPFGSENVELSGLLVGHIVAALDNTIQFQRGQERLSDQALVNQISRAISRTLDLRQLLDSLQAQIDAWLGPARVCLALLDDTRREVSWALAIVDGRAVSGTPRAPSGIVGYILQSQQPLLLVDQAAITKQLQALDLRDDAWAGSRSFLGVPLVLGDRVIGALTLADPQRVPAFDERHQRSLVALAGLVALTIENARLYEMAGQATATAQQRAAQLSTLADSLSVVTAGQRVAEVIDLAFEQLHQLLPYAQAAFWRPAGAAWSLAAARPNQGASDGPSPAELPEALAAEIATTRGAVLVADARADERFDKSAENRGAWLGVPVLAQNEMIGILVLASAEADGYQLGQLPLAQAFAQQTGIAFENARRYEASLQRAQEFERRGTLLAHAAAEFSGNLDLDSLLAVALRTIPEPLGADQAGIVIYTTPPSTVDLAMLERPLAWAQWPPADSQAAAPALLGNPLFERLRQAPSPLVVDDLPENRLVGPQQAAWVGEALQAAVFFPLLVGGRPFGALGLGYSHAHAFSLAELDLGQTLAGQAAAAANNALRFYDVQQRLNEQTVVNQIVRTIGRAGDVEQLVEILRARLGAWVPSDNLLLALYDEPRNEISTPLALDAGRAREVVPFAPGGLLRHVLQTRHALRLGGDVVAQSRELGIPISFIAHRPLRWTDDPNDVLTASSFLGVPILFGDKALGVLAVESSARAQAFGQYHERILATVASQIATLIDTRRLFEQTSQALAAAQERVTQLEALAAALSVIASALYSEDVVGVTLEQFERVIPYDRAAFWRREAGAARELRWRAADARGYPESAEQLTQMLVADSRQLAVLAELVSTRRILTVADTAQDERFQSDTERPARSWLGVPLVNKGEVIGLLIAEKTEPNAYGHSHAASAQILANQITAVLTNTYEYEESVQRVLELDERSRRLAFLNRFAAELGGNLGLGSILQLTLKALAESLGVDQATAAVFDDTRTAVMAMEHYPEVRGARPLALPGSSLIERFQETPAPITVEDLAGPEAPARLRQADWIGQEVRAAMFLPLTSGGKLIGLIGLGQSLAGRRFTPGETELSMGLANLAAVAAQNARLYDRTQQRLAEQAGINQITRALAKSQQPRALFTSLRDQIGAWVGADHVYLAAYDESRNEVSFPLAEAGGQTVSIEPRAPTGLVRYLLQQLEPLRLNGEIAQHLQELGIYDTGLVTPDGLEETATWTSCLAVPLVNDEQVGGVLILANPKRAETFDESHERILSAVAAQVAAALSQARQFEQSRQITLTTQTRAAQLSVLNEAAGIIASANRTEQVIELALDQLQRVIPYDAAYLWQRDGLDGPWRLAAGRGAVGAQTGRVSDLAAPALDPLAEVASTRGPLVIADTRLDGRFASRENRPGSWLGMPLVYQSQLIGLIAIEKAEANSYGSSQASLALAFANQAAVTLANVRQYEDSLRRAFELDERAALLNRASARLSQAVEPRDVLVAALQALTEALGTRWGAALLLDDGRANPRAQISARYPAGELDAASRPLMAKVLLDQLRASLAPVAAGDVTTDSLIRPEQAAWIGPDIQSALFVPLAVAGKLVGVIGLGHTDQRRPFTAAETELAMTLANQAAIAAHNARLYQQTQRRLTELAAITQTSQSIRQTVDLKQVFEMVRNQIETTLHADSFYVALVDTAKTQVSYPLAVDRGQTVEISARPPDRLITHLLERPNNLLLTGDVAARLDELGLAPAADSAAAEAAGERLSLEHAKSFLGVPLLSGTNFVGVLAVFDFQHAFAFTDKHERSAANIAAPLAAAVDSARLNDDTARRALALNAREALLGRLAAELSETSSLSTIAQFVSQMTAETFMADVGAALVLDEAAGTKLPLASARYPDDGTGDLPVFVAAGSPLLEQLRKNLAPITLDELSHETEERAELTAWLAPTIGAALFLPLITADKLIGVVALAQIGRERHFTSGEVELAQSLANQAAIVVANARLMEKMQPRLVELSAISRICQAIGRAGSLAQLAEILVTEITGALEPDTITLAVYDRASEALSFPVLYSNGQKLTASPQAPGGLLGHVLQKRASLLLNGQIEAQLEQLGLTYQSWGADNGVPQSYLAAPLMLGGQVIGVLAVEDHSRAGHYNQSHEFILNTVAGPIAVAVDNLHRQAEHEARGHELAARVAQSALLSRLSTGLMGTLDSEAILSRTLDELVQSLTLDHAVAFLLDSTGADPRVTSLTRALPAPAAPTAPPPVAALQALLQALRPAADPLVIVDLANDARLNPEQMAWLGPDAGPVIVLPLIGDEKLAGVIALGRRPAGRPFAPDEVEVAAISAGQAAMGLSSARLYGAARHAEQRVQAQADQFSRLAEAGETLNTATTAEAVVSATLSQFARALPAEYLLYYRLYDNQLRLIGSAGGPGGAELLGEAPDPAQQPFLSEALGAPRPAVVADAATDKRAALHSNPALPAPRSWLAVRVCQAETNLAIVVAASMEPGVYQADHVEMAQRLANLSAPALDAAERQAASQAQASNLQTELREQGARLEQAQRQLEEYQALNRQNSEKAEGLTRQVQEQAQALTRLEAERRQTADALESQVQEQAEALTRLEAEHRETAEALESQVRERTAVLQRWHERVAGLAQRRANQPPPMSLDQVLSQELLIANPAVGAEASAIYLAEAETGRLLSHAHSGLVEKLPEGLVQADGLVTAAATARQTIVVDDLLIDPRWGTGAAAENPAETLAGSLEPTNHSNGAGQTGSNGNTPGNDTPPPQTAALANNGHYRSAVAVPLMAGEQTLGVLLFLSGRLAAFDPASLPMANAAAGQVAFAIQTADQDGVWRAQAEMLQRWADESAPLVMPTAAGAGVTIRRLPAVADTPEPGQAVPVVAPTRRPTQAPAWRRLALPAGALLVVLCLAGAAIAYGGALKQAASGLFGGAAATPTLATISSLTAGPTLTASTPVPAASLASSATSAATAASTAVTATAEPATATAQPSNTATALPTNTPLPSVSPTVPLPPDVIGLATVVLPNGIVGRLRDAPNGQVIGGVPGNTLVHVLSGRETTSDSVVWVHIRLPNTGQTGWFSEGLLKYVATPTP